VLIQVAAFSALITETLLFASVATQAAGGHPSETIAVTDAECAKASWPNIPDRCLERVQARKSVTTFVLAAGQ